MLLTRWSVLSSHLSRDEEFEALLPGPLLGAPFLDSTSVSQGKEGLHGRFQSRVLCWQPCNRVDRSLAARKALVRVAPSELQLTEISFKDLPLYSYDFDTNYPAVATAFKDAIAAVDAVLFVTPRIPARSIPGALKNAIDWASRPYGTNAFTRKPSAIIGTSPGKIGTAVAQQHLRSILAFCNSPLMNAIEAYIQFEDGLISEDGHVANDATKAFLQNFMAEFHAFISRVYTVLPRNS